MNNTAIIEKIKEEYGLEPSTELHTFNVWKEVYGMKVKKSEKGIPCKLWKKKEKKSKNDDSEESQDYFYLAKSYLFRRDQVEVME